MLNKGNLVIGNGTIDTTACDKTTETENVEETGKVKLYGIFDNFGTLEITSGKFISKDIDISKYEVKLEQIRTIINRSGAVLKVKSGDFSGGTGQLDNEGKAYLYNGKFDNNACAECTQNYEYCISNRSQINKDAKPELYIYDGEFYGVHGVIASGVGYTEIRGGNFTTKECPINKSHTGYHAIYAAGNDGETGCKIYGGKFYSVMGYAAYIGNNIKGDGGKRAKASVEIYGGDFSGKHNVLLVDKGTPDRVVGVLTVSGGRFYKVSEGGVETKFTVANDYIEKDSEKNPMYTQDENGNIIPISKTDIDKEELDKSEE